MLTFRDNSWYQSGNSDVVRDRQRERQREKERAGTVGRPQALAPVPLSFPPPLHSRLDGQVGVAPGPLWAGRWLGSLGGHHGAVLGAGRAMCLRLLVAGGGWPRLGRVLARWVLGIASRARASGRRVTEWTVGAPLGGRAGGLGRLPVLLVCQRQRLLS